MNDIAWTEWGNNECSQWITNFNRMMYTPRHHHRSLSLSLFKNVHLAYKESTWGKNLFSAINLGQLWSHLAKQKKNEKMERDVQIILAKLYSTFGISRRTLISKHLLHFTHIFFLSFFLPALARSLLMWCRVSWPSPNEPYAMNRESRTHTVIFLCFWNFSAHGYFFSFSSYLYFLNFPFSGSSSSLDIFSSRKEMRPRRERSEKTWTFKSKCDNLRMLIIAAADDGGKKASATSSLVS